MRLLVGYCDCRCAVLQGTTIHLSETFLRFTIHCTIVTMTLCIGLHAWITVARDVKILYFIDNLEWFIALSPGSHKRAWYTLHAHALIMSKYVMIFTESVEFRNSVYITRIAYSGEIINACAYNVYQALCESLGYKAINHSRYVNKI